MDLGFLLTVRFGGGMGWHRIHSMELAPLVGARLARFISSGMASHRPSLSARSEGLTDRAKTQKLFAGFLSKVNSWHALPDISNNVGPVKSFLSTLLPPLPGVVLSVPLNFRSTTTARS